jgi:hypothetical protein
MATKARAKAAKAAKRKSRKSVTQPKKVELPKGLRRRKSIPAPQAHMLVASTSSFMAPPPYICVPTGPPPYPCLRYGRDPKTGQYSIPPWGKVMDCDACRAGKK